MIRTNVKNASSDNSLIMQQVSLKVLLQHSLMVKNITQRPLTIFLVLEKFQSIMI